MSAIALRRAIAYITGALCAFCILPASALASIVWTADAEKPASEEWASSAAPGAACAVPNPDMSTPDLSVTTSPAPLVGEPASHPNAYHFHLNDGEECYGPRAELGQANPENPALGDRKFYPGQERWVGFEAYLPNDFQLEDGTGYNTNVMQLKQTGAHGYPAIAMEDGAGYLCLYIDSMHDLQEDGHCGPGTYDLGRPAKNAWIKLLIHVYFSGDEAGEQPGFIEVYGDMDDGNGYRLLLPRVYARTSKLNEEVAGDPPLPTQARIGIYRNPLIKGSEDLYITGFTAATDQASAEAVAFDFGSVSEPESESKTEAGNGTTGSVESPQASEPGSNSSSGAGSSSSGSPSESSSSGSSNGGESGSSSGSGSPFGHVTQPPRSKHRSQRRSRAHATSFTREASRWCGLHVSARPAQAGRGHGGRSAGRGHGRRENASRGRAASRSIPAGLHLRAKARIAQCVVQRSTLLRLRALAKA